MTGEYPPEIVAYFPMVKATVRALDTIEDFAKKQFGYDVSSHLVAGASKRGWDTWLTGAVDTRITAIAPIVMDMLNFTQNVMHMYEAYGGWTFAFVVRGIGVFFLFLRAASSLWLGCGQDYWNANVTVTLGMNQTAINLLANVIDPLVYKENLTMPKLVIDATGDEFFMPGQCRCVFGPPDTADRVCFPCVTVPQMTTGSGGVIWRGRPTV
jgi:PhoPQ-activated pathogenicity-related protein